MGGLRMFISQITLLSPGYVFHQRQDQCFWYPWWGLTHITSYLGTGIPKTRGYSISLWLRQLPSSTRWKKIGDFQPSPRRRPLKFRLTVNSIETTTVLPLPYHWNNPFTVNVNLAKEPKPGAPKLLLGLQSHNHKWIIIKWLRTAWQTITHRPEFYCLVRHVLTVLSVSMCSMIIE